MADNTVPSTTAPSLNALSLVLLVAFASPAAYAQGWQFSPVLAVGGEVDDNARLSVRTDDVVELSGLLVEASADISYKSDTANFLLTPLVLDRTYPSDSLFDSTAFDAILRYSYDTPKNRWRIDGALNQDTIRNAERADQDLDTTDPDDIPDDDTALVSIAGDRTRLILKPSWSYRFSNLTSSELQVNYRDVTYDDVLTGLVDYTDTTLMASLRREYSETTAGFIRGSYRRYDSDDVLREFDSTGLSIGMESQLTPKFRVRARIGAERIELAGAGSTETSPVGELTFIRSLETIRLLAQYRRSVSSSGAGRMSERDAINLNLTRQHNERFESGIGVRAYNNKPIDLTGTAINSFERDYVQLTARFVWNVTRTFSLETTYRFTLLDREVLGESANSNQITAWFIFRPSGVQDKR